MDRPQNHIPGFKSHTPGGSGFNCSFLSMKQLKDKQDISRTQAKILDFCLAQDSSMKCPFHANFMLWATEHRTSSSLSTCANSFREPTVGIQQIPEGTVREAWIQVSPRGPCECVPAGSLLVRAAWLWPQTRQGCPHSRRTLKRT